MTFRRHKRTNFREGGPRASIWRHGQIGINRMATEKYKLHDFEYAVLFYDESTKKIGIMFTNDEKEEGIIKFIRRGKKGGFHISGISFLKLNNIDHSEKKNFPLEWDSENELYTFQVE